MTRLNKAKILQLLNEHKDEISKFGVKRIGLFGSFLNGEGRKNDVDILVKFENPTFDRFMELKFLLEKIFHKNVDLVLEDNLKPALHYVKKEAVYAGL